jgi:hypothetical protein
LGDRILPSRKLSLKAIPRRDLLAVTLEELNSLARARCRPRRLQKRSLTSLDFWLQPTQDSAQALYLRF